MTKRSDYKMRKVILRGTLALMLMLMLSVPAMAIDFELGGKDGTLMGYINQSVGFNIAGGDHYDTQQGFQSAVFQALLETRLQLSPSLKFFGSVNFNADWVYDALNDDDDWQDKGFDDSDDELYMLDDFEDVLKECHITWTPGDFMFRVGKQIVVWGEADGIRVMDQINPSDQRRGITDVEFETSIIPLWLLRAEYFMTPTVSWMTELRFQFIFNPNANFRGNESLTPGNDVMGIWSPNVSAGPGVSVGSFDQTIEEPDEWDSDGYEYGAQIRSVILDAIVTLNYFNGVDNSPVTFFPTGAPRVEVSPYDGRVILHLPEAGFYPDLEFVGITFTRDFPGIYIEALGGVSPVVRFEMRYSMDSTFTSNLGTFEEYDELQTVVGLDWKFKINALNPRAYFFLISNFINRKILDPPDYGLFFGAAQVQPNKWDYIFVLETTYMHNKLIPRVTYWRDQANHANFLKFELGWEQSHQWNYNIGTVFFSGDDEGAGFEPLANKDQIFATVSYRF
jgi:uncharacterized protein DUF1302